MFEVITLEVGDKPLDTDTFQITCSRRELTLIRIATGNQLKERKTYLSMWQKIQNALLNGKGKM